MIKQYSFVRLIPLKVSSSVGDGELLRSSNQPQHLAGHENSVGLIVGQMYQRKNFASGYDKIKYRGRFRSLLASLVLGNTP